jgi:DNA-binding MarR family transcriptional regulator
MLDEKTKKKLEAEWPKRKANLGRLIFITHRIFYKWATERWQKDGWGEIRPEHMRIMSFIGTNNLTVNEIAQRAGVTKQGASKMLTDLIDNGFVEVEQHPTDNRAKQISISKKGADFIFYLDGAKKEMEEKYESIVGKKKMEVLRSILLELTEGLIIMEAQQCGLENFNDDVKSDNKIRPSAKPK